MSRFRIELGGEPLSLPETLGCGQAFRWRDNPDGSFTGVVGGVVATVVVRDGALIVQADGPRKTDRAFWRRYFALDVDYRAIRQAYAADATLARCLAFAPGIRVLRQDFFETLVTFIASQNNNIPRIRKIVEGLCEHFGEAVGAGPDGLVRHAFPSPDRLAQLTDADLAPLHAGYRADYIRCAGKAFAGAAGKRLQARIAQLSTDEARAALLELRGVGPKVADCVLLFGLGRFDSFPVDVWIRRALADLFPQGLPACALPTAGIAQQYIFHFARCGDCTAPSPFNR